MTIAATLRRCAMECAPDTWAYQLEPGLAFLGVTCSHIDQYSFHSNRCQLQ